LEAPKELDFYFGAKGIAQFLGCNPYTVRRWLREGKLPAKKDIAGRWVLCNLDYYLHTLKPKKKSKRRKKTT